MSAESCACSGLLLHRGGIGEEESGQFESKFRWLVGESREQQHTATKLDTTYFATAKEFRHGG